MNETARASIGFARIHVDKLAELSSRKMALTPVEDVIRELSEVVYYLGEAIVEQLAAESEKNRSGSKAA